MICSLETPGAGLVPSVTQSLAGVPRGWRRMLPGKPQVASIQVTTT
jgi:hypothetical protein